MIAAAVFMAVVVLLALVVLAVCADARARSGPVRHVRGGVRADLGLDGPATPPTQPLALPPPTEPLALRDDGLPRAAPWDVPW